MRKLISLQSLLWGAGGLIVGALGAYVLISSLAPGMLISERHSPLDTEATVRTIMTNAVNHGWKVTRIYDYQEALAQPAQPRMAPVRVLELCHPDYDRQLLASGNHRELSAVMPCAIAVYQKADGEVYVASLNTDFLGRIFGGEIKPVMAQVSHDDEEILAFLDER